MRSRLPTTRRMDSPPISGPPTPAARCDGSAVDAGMVWVNSENNRHLPTPFGGMKASGIGRDGGDYSFDFYMETKNICIASRHPPGADAGQVTY